MKSKTVKNHIVLDKERQLGEIISATFGFVSQEFVPLLKSLFLFTSIPVVVLGVIQAFYIKGSFANMLDVAMKDQQKWDVFMEWFPLLALLLFLSTFLVFGISMEFMNQYNQKGHGNFSQLDVWKGFVAKIGRLLGLNIILFFVILAGLVLLLLPGIWISIVSMLMFPVLFFENGSIRVCFYRSFSLVRSHWWQTFAIFLVMMVLQVVLSGILSIPAVVYGIIQGIKIAGDPLIAQDENTSLIIFSVISTIVESWLNVLSFIVLGFQFFNLRQKLNNSKL